MKKLIIAIILCVSAFLIYSQVMKIHHQGKYRWAQKVMADSKANEVDLQPATATIDELNAMPRPDHVSYWNSQRNDVEKHVYAITGKIVFWKEEEDGDIHLVLKSETGKAIVCELPNPRMREARKSIVLQQMKDAKNYFTHHYINKGALYKITGVLFFDSLHEGGFVNGASDSHVELHPILNIKKL